MSEEVKKSQIDDSVLDELIDSFFGEEEAVEKSIDIKMDSKTKADEVVDQAPKFQDDAARGAGRSKEIHDVPKIDQDGQKAKEYDAAISEDAKEEDQEEADQVKEMNQVKERPQMQSKAPEMRPFKKSLSEEEYEEYMALKKAKEEAQAEELKKAEEEKLETLIKSAISKTAEKYEAKIEELQKSLNEQAELVKAVANRPQRSKSITNIQALEKGGASASNEPETFTKSEMLDAATELAMEKSSGVSADHVAELEMTGYIYDANARNAVEKFLAKKK